MSVVLCPTSPSYPIRSLPQTFVPPLITNSYPTLLHPTPPPPATPRQVAKQQQQLAAETSRASHIAASKITMLMHQKSSSSGGTTRYAGDAGPMSPSSRLSAPETHDGIA